MQATLLDHMRGPAEVRRQADDQMVCTSYYDLKLWQPYSQVQYKNGSGRIPLLKRIVGTVSNPVPPIDMDLYFVLEDGRRFNFYVADPLDGSVGARDGTTL